MNSILVTGGCGFIGSNFVRLLLSNNGSLLQANGYDLLINLDALTYAGNPGNLTDLASSTSYEFVHANILDKARIERILAEQSVSTIVHFAAESHVDRSIDSPKQFFETNVIGTLHLLMAAKTHWDALKDPIKKQQFRFLHISTDEVYGSLDTDDPAFCESTPYAPNSPYSASKASSDFLVRSYFQTYGMPVITTNCSNNYGPFQFPEKLIPLVILNALEGKPLPIYGDGKQIRDWLYVKDHCKGILSVLQKGRLGETYCIGGKNEMQNNEIVRQICCLLNELRPTVNNANLTGTGINRYEELITHVKDRPGHDRRYAINYERIQYECSWEPNETCDSGIQKTVKWYLKNQTWCHKIASGSHVRERMGNG